MGFLLDFCRRFCWRACRSGWFSIFWINSQTLVLCACFTTECGNPGIRKSMFGSFSIVCSWLESTWFTTGCPDMSCVISTLRLLLSSDERVWVVLVSTTVCSDLSEETDFSWKEFTSISWDRDVFLPSYTVLVWAPTTGCTDLSRLGFRIGWFDWKFLNCCTTCPSGRWACSEPNSLFQSWRKDIFGGGRGDMYTFS